MTVELTGLTEAEAREFASRRLPAWTGKVEFEGVCTVQLRDGLIRRNEVYFDRTPLLVAAPPGLAGLDDRRILMPDRLSIPVRGR